MLRTFAIFLLALVHTPSYAQDKAIHDRLMHFYAYYIADNDTKDTHHRTSADTLRQYCTASFLKKLPGKSASCDCDPIIQAQDYDKNWIKTLTVTNAGPHKYDICFNDFDTHRNCFTVTVAQENGKLKINNVAYKDTKK